MNLSDVTDLAARIKSEIAKAIIGQEDAVDLLLISLFAGGHVLLEGPPGTAKTFLSRTFASTMHLEFNRIQFTPDLMPGDVLGANIFDFKANAFTLTKGPIFTEVLLADEINRTPPKTQAALLEAMQERSVTIDGATHPLSDRFMVIATQNPLEQLGTYPLPEAQLDRFLFKHTIDYPSREQELKIAAQHGRSGVATDSSAPNISAVTDAASISLAVATVSDIRMADDITAYAVDLVRRTREGTEFAAGASPRAAAMLCAAARARAALDGREYVIPDDVKALAISVLRHRVILSPAAEIEGRNADELLMTIIDTAEVPR